MGIADCHFKETGMAEKDHSASQSAENHIDLDNPELQNALQIIQYTRRSLFLTGKAGTGKSTFLRYIAAHTNKKHIILAPTGIAAINAGEAPCTVSSRFPSIRCCPTTVCSVCAISATP